MILIKETKKWFTFFVINVFVGVFTYFILISLQMLNQLDSIWHYGYGGAGNWERSLGRWMLPFVDDMRFGLLTNPFCNVSAICIFVLGNIFIFEIFEFGPTQIRTYLISFIIIVSTSMGAWLSFRYTSDGYAVAYLFAILTVYLCKRNSFIEISGKWNIKKPKLINNIIMVVMASISLMISLACYQAFFDSTCLVMIAAFMLMLYRNKNIEVIILYLIKSVVSIVCGTVLYFAGMNISFAKHGIEHIGSYNAGDSLGFLNTILNIPNILSKTIYYFRTYFFDTYFRWNRLQEHAAFRILIFGILIATFVVGIIRIAKKNVVYAILFLICCFLLVIATNVVLFVATESFLSIQMTNGLSMFLPIAFVLVFEILVEYDGTIENAASNDISSEKKRICHIAQKIIRAVAVLTSVLIIYGNYVSTQIDQEACREGINGTVTLAGEILDTLKNIGYADTGGRVCFVGVPCNNERFMYSEIYPMANELMQFGNWDATASTHKQTWGGIYREYFGAFVEPCTEEEYESITTRADVKILTSQSPNPVF